MKNFIKIRNGSKEGSLTSFAVDIDRVLYGLSAAHILLGENNYIDPYDIIEREDIETKKWMEAGVLVKSIYSNGSKKISDFGTIDAGIFELNNLFKKKISDKLKPLLFSKYLEVNPNNMIGETLYAYSIMQNKKIKGKIKNIFYITAEPYPRKFDLEIESLDSKKLTIDGDSGIIWKDKKGKAVAMHIHGDTSKNRFSYSTFIDRITKNLNINLLEIDKDIEEFKPSP